MDRSIVYVGELPRYEDFLGFQKDALYALGDAIQAMVGTPTAAHGLAIAATSPASLQVTIGTGAIYSQQTVDATAYGPLGTDPNTITKQGLLNSPVTLTITPPTTSGYSQVYLVEAAYLDQDGGSIVLPYYNSANPSQPLNGPSGAGTSQYTIRQGLCTILLKAGAAAPTGSQVAPAVDSGYVPLYLITVANGQTTITSANWSAHPSAPFIPLTLPQIPVAIQQQAGNYAVDAGTANALAITLPSSTSLVAGMPIRFKKGASGNTSACTITVNGGSPISLLWADGSVMASGDLPANCLGQGIYDGAAIRLNSPSGPSIFARVTSTRPRLTIPSTIYINSSTGSDSNPGTSAAPFLTLQAAVNYAQLAYDLNGQTLTFRATGTFSAGVNFSGLFSGQVGPAGLVLDLTSATISCVGNCVSAINGALVSVTGGVFACTTSGTTGYAIAVSSLSTIVLNGGHTFGVCGLGHLASFGGQLTVSGSYTINGNAPIHLYTAPGGQIVTSTSLTVTLSGSPAFSTACAYAAFGYIQFANVTFSGSATGVRYSVIQYGLIYTAGGGASYFPGNSAGSVTAGTYA